MAFVLQQFKKEHLSQYLQLAMPSFREDHPLLLSMDRQLQQFRKTTTITCTAFIQASERVNARNGTNVKYNTFIEINGRMIVASFSIDLEEYCKVVQHQIPFNKLNWNDQFIQSLNGKKCIVSGRLAVHRKQKKMGIFEKYMYLRAKNMVENMYEYDYCWIYSPIVLKYFQQNDRFEVIQVKTQQVHGQILKLYHGRINLPRVVATATKAML